jgi:hypothetical protein
MNLGRKELMLKVQFVHDIADHTGEEFALHQS